jgi:hypothetical protein
VGDVLPASTMTAGSTPLVYCSVQLCRRWLSCETAALKASVSVGLQGMTPHSLSTAGMSRFNTGGWLSSVITRSQWSVMAGSSAGGTTVPSR